MQLFLPTCPASFIHWFSDAAGFKAGDSVRLRMEIDDLSLEFFDQELTHIDIGYILERNEKEQVHASAVTQIVATHILASTTRNGIRITKKRIDSTHKHLMRCL